MEGHSVNILVVEDEADVAAGLARSLRREEGVHHVQVAGSAEWALEELGRRSYTLILCDVRLKGMDGLELLSRVRQTYGGTRVLMMTAFPSEHIRLHAWRLGADGVLEKPFDLEALRGEVRRVLRQARRQQTPGSHGQARRRGLEKIGSSEV